MHTRSAAHTASELRMAPAEDLPRLIEAAISDRRATVVHAVEAAQRRLVREGEERVRLARLARIECELLDSGLTCVAGVDEVGRGALAGPVSAGACVFPRDAEIPGLTDSKRLTPRAREQLASEIKAAALYWAVAHVGPEDIDRLGIASATILAMRKALESLGTKVDRALVDGLPVDVGMPSTAIVGGDGCVRAIAAASIVAKVTRDALMVELEQDYPGYGLGDNKGYGSAAHLAALGCLGPSSVHRRSFSPCAELHLF